MEARFAESNPTPDVAQLTLDWIKIREKPGGKNNDGSLSGVYHHRDSGEEFLIKQDRNVAKNIAEFVAGSLLQRINPVNADIFAEIRLFYINGESTPNEKGDNVYVGSRWFADSIELWKDAYNAYNHLDVYENLRRPTGQMKTRPKHRPKWIRKDPILSLMLKHGRYNDMLMEQLVDNAFIENPDVNTENFGVIPKPCGRGCKKNCSHNPLFNEAYTHTEGGKEEVVYSKVRCISYDYGGALGDNRRKLDDQLHIFDVWRYIKPVSFFNFFSGDGPPNYFSTYHNVLAYKPFMRALIKRSCTPIAVINESIFEIMKEVKKYYGQQQLLEFARHIGADDFIKERMKHIPLNDKTEIDHLISYITLFLQHKFRNRLQHTHAMAKKMATDLKMNAGEFDALVAEIQVKTDEEFADRMQPKQYNRYDYEDTSYADNESCSDEMGSEKISSNIGSDDSNNIGSDGSNAEDVVLSETEEPENERANRASPYLFSRTPKDRNSDKLDAAVTNQGIDPTSQQPGLRLNGLSK